MVEANYETPAVFSTDEFADKLECKFVNKGHSSSASLYKNFGEINHFLKKKFSSAGPSEPPPPTSPNFKHPNNKNDEALFAEYEYFTRAHLGTA